MSRIAPPGNAYACITSSIAAETCGISPISALMTRRIEQAISRAPDDHQRDIVRLGGGPGERLHGFEDRCYDRRSRKRPRSGDYIAEPVLAIHLLTCVLGLGDP